MPRISDFLGEEAPAPAPASAPLSISAILGEAPPAAPAEEGLLDRAGRDLSRVGQSILSGYYQGGGRMYHTAGNLADFVRRQIPNATTEEVTAFLRRAEQLMQRRAAETAPAGEQSVAERVYQGLGAAPVDIATVAPAVAAAAGAGPIAGPAAGMGLMSALQHADEGAGAALQAGAQGALAGGVLGATAPLTTIPRTLVNAGTGAVQAATEGAPMQDVVAGALTQGALGALPTGGTVTTRDLLIGANRRPVQPMPEPAPAPLDADQPQLNTDRQSVPLEVREGRQPTGAVSVRTRREPGVRAAEQPVETPAPAPTAEPAAPAEGGLSLYQPIPEGVRPIVAPDPRLSRTPEGGFRWSRGDLAANRIPESDWLPQSARPVRPGPDARDELGMIEFLRMPEQSGAERFGPMPTERVPQDPSRYVLPDTEPVVPNERPVIYVPPGELRQARDLVARGYYPWRRIADTPEISQTPPIGRTEAPAPAAPLTHPEAPTPPSGQISRSPEQVVERTAPTPSTASVEAPVVEPQQARYEARVRESMNISQFRTPGEINDHLRSLAQDAGGFVAQRRGIIRQEEMQRLATSLGVTGEQLAQRRAGETWTPERMRAALDWLDQSARDITEAARRVGEGPEARTAFIAKLAENRTLQAALGATEGAAAEAGRLLAQLRRANARGGPAQAAEIARLMHSDLPVEDIARMIVMAEGNVQVVNDVAREAVRPTHLGDRIQYIWMNGLLSNPKTHIINTATNFATGLGDAAEHYLAAAYDLPRRAAGARDIVTFREATERVRGYFGSIGEGLAAFRDVFTGADANSPFVFPDFQSSPGLGPLERVAPVRFLRAEDALARAMAGRMELRGLAAREGLRRGLRGRELREFIDERIRFPSSEEMQAAQAKATYLTFQQRLGEIGQAFMKFRQQVSLAPVGLPGVRPLMWAVPFMTTPTNVLKYAVERSPLSLLSPATRERLSAGGITRSIQMARITMGLGVLGMAAAMAERGALSGAGPTDPEERAALRATGWQPYSIKIGDRWIDYRRLDQVSPIIGAVADIHDLWRNMGDRPREQAMSLIQRSVANNVFDQAFMRGLSDVAVAIANPERSHYLEGLAASTIPAVTSIVTQTLDPDYRQARGIIDSVQARIPGLSQDLPPRLDIFGREVQRNSPFTGRPGETVAGRMAAALSPFTTSAERDDPVASELVRLRTQIQAPPRTLRGVPLTDEQQEAHGKRVGTLIHEMLAAQMATPAYQQASDAAKEQRIRAIVSAARDAAFTELMTNDARYRAAYASLQRQRATTTSAERRRNPVRQSE